MLRVGVLVSGGGTNLQAIIDGIKNKVITNTEIEVVISNKKDAYALVRAKEMELMQNVFHLKILLKEKILIRR